MKLLDTDILVEFFKNNSKAVAKIKELTEGQEQIATTVLNAQELLFGFLNKKMEKYLTAEEFLLEIGVIEYRFEDVKNVIQIKQELAKNGKPIGAHDEMIAGICLSINASIITRNTKHFSKVKGLKVEKW